MKRPAGFMTMALVLCTIPIFAQYEETITLPDAPTRTEEQAGLQCTLEGLQIARQEGENGARNVSVSFLLSRKPAVYFHYFDARKKAVVFDFYDTHIGESPIDSIQEMPISGSSVQFFRIDLNKNVAGLKPDFREVVRVSLYTPSVLKYDVQEDEGLITMSFKSGGDQKETRLKPEGTAYLWQIPLAVVLAGAAGFAAYQLFLK